MQISAGILMYKIEDNKLYVFLVHNGGPYFKNKDNGYWGIPKGLIEESDHNLLNDAKREFKEETGLIASDPLIDLGSIVQKNNKKVYCWAFNGNLPKGYVFKSNLFKLEWPPKSGKFQEFPEVDKGEFFDSENAKVKIIAEQFEFIRRLEENLANK